jgi:anti-anti-sigma factor
LISPSPRIPSVEIEHIEGPRALRIIGEVDLSNADDLRAAAGAEVEELGGAVLDLSRCTYIGSEGIRVIVAMCNRTSEGGRVVLQHPTSHVRRVLKTAGLDRLPKLDIEGSS